MGFKADVVFAVDFKGVLNLQWHSLRVGLSSK